MTATCREACCSVTPRLTVAELFERGFRRNREAPRAIAGAPFTGADTSTTPLFYPEMKAFRHDARFMPFAKRLGLVDYWKRSGHWPDFCADPDIPYDCRKVAATL